MLSSSKSTFNSLLEKATSHLLLEPDWDSTLLLCDMVRSGEVKASIAVSLIKKKLTSDNPHVAIFALNVLEALMKNCGSVVHDEVASKEFMDFWRERVMNSQGIVQEKMCELLQVWSHVFRNQPQYNIFEKSLALLKLIEDLDFPEIKVTDAMFEAEVAPEWKDGSTCFRCRNTFSVVNRKHHCRCCGQIFCSSCSSHSVPVPKFGINRKVRVCESCYEDLKDGRHPSNALPAPKNTDNEVSGLPREYLESDLYKESQAEAQKPKAKDTEAEEEEFQLQLALALSQSEAESGKKTPHDRSLRSSSIPTANIATDPTPVSAVTQNHNQADPELQRYLDRSYWEVKQSSVKKEFPSRVSPAPSAPVKQEAEVVGSKDEVDQSDLELHDEEKFCSLLESHIEMLLNRMRSNQQRGRPIALDTTVQSLFLTISQSHDQLLKCLQQQEEKRTHLEAVQEKVGQIREAREALDSLREEQAEMRRQEAAAAERQRQMAMVAKLGFLRQKKQEMLEERRQEAIYRIKEQERQMALKLEQQKMMSIARQRQNQLAGFPQAFPPSLMQTPGLEQMTGPPPQHGHMYGGAVAHSNVAGPVGGPSLDFRQPVYPPMAYQHGYHGVHPGGYEHPPPSSDIRGAAIQNYFPNNGNISQSEQGSGASFPPGANNPPHFSQENMQFVASQSSQMQHSFPAQSFQNASSYATLQNDRAQTQMNIQQGDHHFYQHPQYGVPTVPSEQGAPNRWDNSSRDVNGGVPINEITNMQPHVYSAPLTLDNQSVQAQVINQAAHGNNDPARHVMYATDPSVNPADHPMSTAQVATTHEAQLISF